MLVFLFRIITTRKTRFGLINVCLGKVQELQFGRGEEHLQIAVKPQSLIKQLSLRNPDFFNQSKINVSHNHLSYII